MQAGAPASLSERGAATAGPQPPKRPRLTVERSDLTQPLSIDVSQTEPKRVST